MDPERLYRLRHASRLRVSRVPAEVSPDAAAPRAPDHQDMPVTYAVTWAEPDGLLQTGRLELKVDGLMCEGGNGSGQVARLILYTDVRSFRVAAPHERLDDRPTLIVESGRAGFLRIAGVGQPGVVSELAERLASLVER